MAFWYTEVMVRREIKLEKLVVDNYTTEEILNECVRQLSGKMTEEALGEKKVYWEILVSLSDKINGRRSTKVI